MSDIPHQRRLEVAQRDGWTDTGAKCRLCGQWTSMPAVHHIKFRSQRGDHSLSNLITLAQEFGHDCHLVRAHGPNARLWREAFEAIVDAPYMTAIQWRRWNA